MRTRLPGPPNLAMCKGPYQMRKARSPHIELSRSGNPPSYYLAEGSSPQLTYYQLGFYNEASTRAMHNQDLLLRIQTPVEVINPLEGSGVDLEPGQQVVLCSYLYKPVDSPGTDAERWLAGYADIHSDPGKAVIYINFFDYPSKAKSTFSLATATAYYTAKASVINNLTERYPEKAHALAQLFAASVEFQTGKMLIDRGFESFNYTHWETVTWESSEGSSFFRASHRFFQALVGTLESKEAKEAFNIQGSFRDLSSNSPILVRLK